MSVFPATLDALPTDRATDDVIEAADINAIAAATNAVESALRYWGAPDFVVYLDAADATYKAKWLKTGEVVSSDANDVAVPINYAFANGPSTGTHVALAGGTLFQRTAIVLKRDGDGLVGLGHRNVTRLRLADTVDPVTAMIVIGRDGNLTRCRLERLHLYGGWTPLSAAGHLAGHGVVAYGGAHVLRDVSIESVIGDGLRWESQDGATSVFELWSDNTSVINCGNDGIYCSPQTFNGEFLRNTVQGAAKTLTNVSMVSGSATVTNNDSVNNPFVPADDGLVLRVTGAAATATYLWGTFTYVSASQGTLSVTAGATATGTQGLLFRGSRYGIYNQGTQHKFLLCHPYHTQDNAYYSDTGVVEPVLIGGEYESVAGHGIRMLAVTRAKIHATLAYGNGRSGKLDASISSCVDADIRGNTWRSDAVAQNLALFAPTRGLVHGNTLKGGTSQGLRVQTGSGVQVQDNHIQQVVLDGTTDCLVQGNNVLGSITEVSTNGTPNRNRIEGNQIGGGGTPTITAVGAATKVRRNAGWATEATGAAAMASGTTSVAVTHGLAAAPTRVLLTPTSDTLGIRLWVSAKGTTTFTVSTNTAPGSDVTFDWRALVGDE